MTGSISLNYSSTDPDGDAITYNIFIDNTLNPSTLVYSGNSTNYTFTNTSGTYNWKVMANDSHFNSSDSAIYTFYSFN